MITSSGYRESDQERHYETHCGDLVKILWHDGLGMSLYANYVALYCSSFRRRLAS